METYCGNPIFHQISCQQCFSLSQVATIAKLKLLLTARGAGVQLPSAFSMHKIFFFTHFSLETGSTSTGVFFFCLAIQYLKKKFFWRE